MGAAAVGKTCIISRLLYESFVSEYKATVEELHSGEYELDGRPVTLDILDTSGTSPVPSPGTCRSRLAPRPLRRTYVRSTARFFAPSVDVTNAPIGRGLGMRLSFNFVNV